MGKLDDVTRMAPSGGWTTAVPKLLSLRGTHRLSNGESKAVEKNFATAVEVGDVATAVHFAGIGLALDEARFLPAIRRRG